MFHLDSEVNNLMQQESSKVSIKIQIKRLEQAKQSWLIRGYLLIIVGLLFTSWILIFEFQASYLIYIPLSIAAIFFGYHSLSKARETDEDIKKLKKILRY